MLRGGCLTAIAMALAGSAHSQIPKSFPGPTSPNRFNQDIDTRQKIEAANEQHAREQASVQARVTKFMEAIKPRRHLFADFDLVVIHGKAPVTPSMLALMAESPYAADIAYYLGKHPQQSGSIAQMRPEQARLSVQQIEASVAANNPIRR